jgi:mono/diheme cytochrome c family protein
MRLVLVLLAVGCIGYGVHWQTRATAPLLVRMPDVVGEGSVGRGRAVYASYGCAACHGTDGKGGFANTNAETEGKVPGVTFVAEGFTRAELRKKILDGFPTVGKKDPNGPRPPYRMPGWAGQMSNAEVGDLVEYLWSLYPKSEAQKWR